MFDDTQNENLFSIEECVAKFVSESSIQKTNMLYFFGYILGLKENQNYKLIDEQGLDSQTFKQRPWLDYIKIEQKKRTRQVPTSAKNKN